MIGVAACIAARSARSRGTAIGAALPTKIGFGTSAPSLSYLFEFHCRVQSTITNAENENESKISLLRSRHLFRSHRRESARGFASKSDEGDDVALPEDTVSGSSQHDTWVQFQRSISVSGVDTGQTVKERLLGKKNRGGKAERKRKEREAELEAKMKGLDSTQLKGGEFPTLSYSEEETQRLLAEAYANIPPRAGKRGTNNLRRQKRRWFIKRQYDYKKKRERIAEHESRMLKRKETTAAMRKTREEAPEVRQRERGYQDMILQRWALMNGHVKEEAEQKLIE